MPDPSSAADLADFIGLLGELRAWAGTPSYRMLAERVGPLMRPTSVVSHSTLVDAFKPGRRRLDMDLVMATVRALGVSEPEAVRWRQACIRVHAEAKTGGPVGVLSQLPTDLATFTGRREELTRLIEAATHQRDEEAANTVVISAIEGMAGVGKTQLAIHAAHQLVRSGRFADVQLHANLRGFDAEHPPTDPSAVLEAFLRQLGVPAQQIPGTRDERAAMFRDRLRERHALILLDNAADENQVRDLIPANPTCLVLITSRRSLTALDNATPHQLDVFTGSEALALLARIAGHDRVAAEPEAAARIAEYCGYLPLAVSLAAARLRSRPAWPLQHLADKLRDGRLSAIRAGNRTLRPVFHLSYQELDEPLRRIFRLLGHHPGPDTTPAQVAALADIPADQAEDALEHLQDEHLLTQPTPGRYELHDLLRLLAVELAAAEPEPEPAAPLTRLATWCLATGYTAATTIGTPNLTGITRAQAAESARFEDYDDALAWFDEEQHTLAAVQQAAAEAGLHQHVWQLAEAQKHFFVVRRHLDDFLTAQHLAVAATRAEGDRKAEALMLTTLGGVYWMAGRLDESEDCCLKARHLYQATDDHMGEASTLIAHGVVKTHQGDHEPADELFSRALDLLDGPEALPLRAKALLNRADVHKSHRDRRPQAIAGFREALTILRQIGDRHSEAFALGNIADCHRLDGDLDTALDLYREQQDLARTLADAYIQAEALLGIGDTHAGAQRTAAARHAWTKALALYEKIDHPKATEARRRLAEQ
ncbi:tetratricopeptide repeat protein [Kitasatospora sp. MAA4]|uniref:tetratricopeptide repeat protein n=1 Tax=Kitasatospora sp. MAA4 TaxID=3035093 RepID=UPI002472EB72|nr:tetratricopeptide repeat protein [Kitasatospora sp. MAA4]